MALEPARLKVLYNLCNPEEAMEQDDQRRADLDARGGRGFLPNDEVNIYRVERDDLYLTGEKDKNILSLGNWFSTPSSGESFFTKDRTVATNRYLLPHGDQFPGAVQPGELPGVAPVGLDTLPGADGHERERPDPVDGGPGSADDAGQPVCVCAGG